MALWKVALLTAIALIAGLAAGGGAGFYFGLREALGGDGDARIQAADVVRYHQRVLTGVCDQVGAEGEACACFQHLLSERLTPSDLVILDLRARNQLLELGVLFDGLLPPDAAEGFGRRMRAATGAFAEACGPQLTEMPAPDATAPAGGPPEPDATEQMP